jgi:hypothetical protein
MSSIAIGTVGILLIIMGSVTQNKAIEILPAHSIHISLQQIVIVIGWCIVLAALWRNIIPGFNRSVLLGSAAVIIAHAVSQQFTNERFITWTGYAAGAAWLVFGWVAASSSEYHGLVGLLLAAVIMISTHYILPWQKDNNICDGPAWPLASIAWILLLVVNSASLFSISPVSPLTAG